MKKRVRYSDLGRAEIGEYGFVKPVDHPIKSLNGEWTRTSRVLKRMDTARGPVFETAYSIYWPAETDEKPVMFLSKESNV